MPRKIAVARGKFQVYLLESLEQFAELKTVWLDLERQTDQPCFFQSYAWCGHVAEVLMRTLPDRYTPLVAYATQDGVPVALWPLSRQKRSGTWQLRPIDDPFGQFSGILGRDADAIIALVAATLLMVRERKLADAVRLEFVLAGSPLECALQQSGLRSRGEVGAPYLDTRLWPSIAELKASRNKKTMKNLRNSNNRLSKAGAYEHRYETDKDRVGNIINATLQRRTAWLEEKGLTAPQFRSAAHEEIISGGQLWGLDKGRVGYELLCGGNAIAHQWGFMHQKRYYAFMSAIDPDAVQLSPGRLHLSFVIADAMREGIETIEMLTPASEYKLVWTDTVRTLRDMAMPLTPAGWAVDLLWERTLRPVVKTCFYALPARLRKFALPNDANRDRDDGKD